MGGNWLDDWNSPPENHYKIVEGDGLEDRIYKVIGSMRLFDDVREVKDWAVNRDPYAASTPIAGTNIRMLELATVPILVIYLRIEEERKQVVYLDLHQLEGEPER